VAQSVRHLPSARVVIPGSWDPAPHQAPCSAGSLLLPLLAAPPACTLFLSVKSIKKKKHLKKIVTQISGCYFYEGNQQQTRSV